MTPNGMEENYFSSFQNTKSKVKTMICQLMQYLSEFEPNLRFSTNKVLGPAFSCGPSVRSGPSCRITFGPVQELNNCTTHLYHFWKTEITLWIFNFLKSFFSKALAEIFKITNFIMYLLIKSLSLFQKLKKLWFYSM